MANISEVIPTIDMKDISDTTLNKKIREASESWGCFKVINHGVPLSLMSAMKKTVRDLRERPREVKMRNADVPLGSGYRGPCELNPFYESFGVFDMASAQAVHNFCDQLETSPDQRETMVKYGKATDSLAKDLTRRLGESYELTKTGFFEDWPSHFRMSIYDFKPETIGKKGLISHTGPGFLTILQGDEDVGGLEAMDTCSETYLPINTSQNTLTVILGDMAAIWSNGRLRNVKHRVLCKDAKMRITIASFLLGPMYTDLEPPSEFVDAEHPRLYKAISHQGIQDIRMTMEMHNGEALKVITYE